MKRKVADCPNRLPLQSGTANEAACALLMRITESDAPELAGVGRDLCEACCASFPPTESDWNPVIASAVYQIGSRLSDTAGDRLCAMAVEQLPVVLPDEDDCVDDIQLFRAPLGVKQDELRRVLPPAAGGEASVSNWSVGVTTAPRRQSTLATCLEGLTASGWRSVSLFVDGEVEIPTKYRPLIRQSRSNSIGAWPAWIAAVKCLLQQPRADALMIIQDDTLFPKIASLKAYVESLLWPHNQPCLVSLYTSAEDTQRENLWREYPDRWRYGALAIVMPPSLASELIAASERGELDVTRGTAGIDLRIGVWAAQHNIPIWHPSPSLVQHIGQVSSVWQQSRAVGLRRADRFIADEFIADEFDWD